MSEQVIMTIDDARFDGGDGLRSVRQKALIAGVIGALATAGGYFAVGRDVFYRAYLIGWLFWLGIAVGLLSLGMIAQVAGGRWGIQMRRVQEASGRTLWFFLILALPICFGGLESLFSWARDGVAASDALVAEKTGYLKAWFDFEGTNPEWMATFVPGFIPRILIIFVLWLLWAYRLSALSNAFDAAGTHEERERARDKQIKWCAGGLLVFAVVATFASIDWVMSTDPHWFSSLYGPQFIIWQLLSGVAFSIPLMIFFGNREPLKHLLDPKQFHAYGKWMLAFTMVWGYFNASQIIIIWSGNLPEEVGWYIHRSTGGWYWFTAALVLFTFFVPFVILLFQPLKFKPKILLRIALLVLATRWLDYYWNIVPNLHPDGFTMHVFDVIAPIGIGGLWIWLLFGQVQGKVLVPVHDPVIQEALSDG
ncbi:MAG: hypothetical protein MPN21_00715 [Thermoanaerobaculia bacterium]|nr:hypothetical protein [Thermoanaerobaculia bacterium]